MRYIPFAPFARTKESTIEARAQATQKTLCLLEAKIAANIVDQIQVIIHWIGVPPLATAREIERGMFIIDTVSHACQFEAICFPRFLKFSLIIIIN